MKIEFVPSPGRLVQITMTEEEASTLYMVTMNIGGGHPRRKHIENIEQGLRRLGVEEGERNLKPSDEKYGSLYFAYGDNRR